MRRNRKLGRRPRVERSQSEVPTGSHSYYELEVIPGLNEFAQAELNQRTGTKIRLLHSARPDRVRFRYAGNPQRLLELRQSVAVSRVEGFDIPRPKAMLGHQNFQRLMHLIESALAMHEPRTFKTFHISAAGSVSTVFARIKTEIEASTALTCSEEEGDLLLAVRRPDATDPFTNYGWEVAVRLSPRPLSARPWRVCDMPGALNATIASMMMSLTSPAVLDRVVNLVCGSGTLLIERLALGSVTGALGCDIDAGALNCARQNLMASGNAEKVCLIQCDAGQVPISDGWATTVCADLPFGMLVGSHQDNELLYPRLLVEAARLTGANGTLVVITHESRLFERVITAHADRWDMMRTVSIKLPANTRSGYIHPRVYLLRRRI